MLQPERIVAIAAVGRPPGRLYIGGAPGFGADRSQEGGRMKRPGTHFLVIGLHNDAASFRPELLQRQNQVLKAHYSGRIVLVHVGTGRLKAAQYIGVHWNRGARQRARPLAHEIGAEPEPFALYWCDRFGAEQNKDLLNSHLYFAPFWHASCKLRTSGHGVSRAFRLRWTPEESEYEAQRGFKPHQRK